VKRAFKINHTEHVASAGRPRDSRCCAAPRLFPRDPAAELSRPAQETADEGDAVFGISRSRGPWVLMWPGASSPPRAAGGDAKAAHGADPPCFQVSQLPAPPQPVGVVVQ
jgi:hypothetical protein